MKTSTERQDERLKSQRDLEKAGASDPKKPATKEKAADYDATPKGGQHK